MHAWLPYYAGFSEDFVASLLDEFKVGDTAIVFDPMNGSGTTTLVAQQTGYCCIGADLNPAAAAIARAKNAALVGRALAEIAKETADAARRISRLAEMSPDADAWFHSETFTDVRRLQSAIQRTSAEPLAPIAPRLLATLNDSAPCVASIRAFLTAALIVAARRASRARPSKNPTWLKRSTISEKEPANLLAGFVAAAAEMEADLVAAFGPDKSPVDRALVLDADARALPLKSASIDLIVTSPPYLTRIDYAVTTAVELATLGVESASDQDRLRREIMGSTCITGGRYEMRKDWGPTCRKVLELIRRHPSKASSGYYFKNHVQYFRDAAAILREYLRVLKRGAPAALVVQDSWYKDIHVPLGTIYVEMARALGASTSEIVRSDHVRSHLGLVNTRARKYSKGELFEHVVLIRGRKT